MTGAREFRDKINSIEDIEKYQKLKKPLSSRLSNYKITQEGCWEWLGAKDRKGYGNLIIKGPNGLRQIGAHRLAYIALCGQIPTGMHVLHRCDNPPCINPDHLFLGSPKDNMHDMLAKGRHPSQKSSLPTLFQSTS